MSKLFSTCSGNKVKKQTFDNIFGFYVYSDFKRNLFRLLEVSLCKFVKTAFYQFRRTLWSKNFRENLQSLFCRVVIKMFSDFSQKLYIRVVKSIFYVFSNYNEETDFSEKFTSCLVHTRTLSIISSEFWGQNFPQVFKTASYIFRRTLWWKTILLKNLLQFLHCGRNSSFWLTTVFLLQICQNCILRLQVSILIKKDFEKLFLVFFRTVSNLFSDFRQNIYRQVVETVLYVFRNLFEYADFFNCFVFGANLDFEQIFFLTCGTNFSVKLSKLLSPYSDDYFDGKHFFGRFFNLSSDSERNIFWTWVKFSQKSSQQRILRVQKTFWRNWFFGEISDQYVY